MTCSTCIHWKIIEVQNDKGSSKKMAEMGWKSCDLKDIGCYVHAEADRCEWHKLPRDAYDQTDFLDGAWTR